MLIPSSYISLIYPFSFQRCIHSIKVLALCERLVQQLKKKEKTLLQCKYDVDIFWVLFSTVLLKQDPTRPGDCTKPEGLNCCCPGSTGTRSVWERKKRQGITFLCLTYFFQGRHWDLVHLEKWWKPPRMDSQMLTQSWQWLWKCLNVSSVSACTVREYDKWAQ